MAIQDPSALDCSDAAGCVGLIYSPLGSPGLSRRGAGKGFSYRDPDGRPLKDAAALARIKLLVIPPAWTQVWICPDPNGHIQALGQDAKGRRQYLYHPTFREARDSQKFDHMIAFAKTLPRLRQQVDRDMATRGLGRRKVVATVVRLLETTMVRIGNAAYARDNKSYGLTTLLTPHVQVEGAQLKFHFKGKSGKIWRLGVEDRRVARIVKSRQELPGQRLFQYLDEDGQRQTVSSADVNAYLKEASDTDITAKDFRTWAGAVLTAWALVEAGPATSATAAKRTVAQEIKSVAARLGNTPTVCRQCYVHPEIITAYLEGELKLRPRKSRAQSDTPSLAAEEAAVLAFLRGRTAGERADPASQREAA